KKQSTQFEFREYLLYWYHNIYVPRSDCTTKISAGYTLYHFIIPALIKSDNVSLSAVTATMLNNLIKRCDYCKTSMKQAYKLLQAAFSDAFADGYVTDNIMLSVDNYYWPTPKPVTIYTKEEIKIFLDYISRNYRQVYLEIVLALFCGLRTGEIRGLRFEDVNSENSTISIRRQITSNYNILYTNDHVVAKRNGKKVKAPKSDSSTRTLRVHRIVFELLKERFNDIQEQKGKETEKWNDRYDGYVCIGQHGDIKGETTCNAALKRICGYVSLPVISMHDLRHMAASLLFEQKVDLLRISAFLGHKSPNTTFDLYIEQIEGSPRLKQIIDDNFNPFPLTPVLGGGKN
ncbi:MAG: site-specific integrase, partial [Clostridiaceae bacterium]|nr:site-specific integrase [Clostridiaceae bacterium]